MNRDTAFIQYLINISLCFIILAFLKGTGQLFCKIILNLGLSDVFSWLDSGCIYIFGRNIAEVMYHIKRHMLSIRLSIGDVNVAWLRGGTIQVSSV